MRATTSLQCQQCKGDGQGGTVEDSAVFSTSRPAPSISIAVISEQTGAIQRKIPIDAKSSCISSIESIRSCQLDSGTDFCSRYVFCLWLHEHVAVLYLLMLIFKLHSSSQMHLIIQQTQVPERRMQLGTPCISKTTLISISLSSSRQQIPSLLQQ